MILLACLVLLVALGLVERLAARRARAAVPIRIHVNGTRGKSTVTRLVAAALREAGIPTFAKVTGTTPRLILPDGSEQPVVRRAPANIREQAWLLRRAGRAGARALVAECMAVRPDLLWVSEREMLQATIGVITNVRFDHTEVMGRTLDRIAQSLANSVPRRGILVTGDRRFAALFAARCAKLGTRVIVAENGGGRVLPFGMIPSCGPVKNAHEGERPPDPLCPSWLREDIAIALAVTRALGISDEVATRGMERAAPDPGAAAQGRATLGGREIGWIDATAANDPESLDLLADEGRDSCRGAPTIHLTVYNHRFDRPARLATFAASSRVFRASRQILLTGDRPSLSLAARVRRLCPGAGIRFVGRGHVSGRRPSRRSGALRKSGAATADRLLAALEDALARQPDVDRIVFCGNTRGFARPFPAPVDDRHATPDTGRRTATVQ